MTSFHSAVNAPKPVVLWRIKVDHGEPLGDLFVVGARLLKKLLFSSELRAISFNMIYITAFTGNHFIVRGTSAS